jgi:hypothetical protein
MKEVTIDRAEARWTGDDRGQHTGNRPLKRVVLEEWEEYVGRLRGVEESEEGDLAIFGSSAVAVFGASEDLRKWIGKKVGILRTDDPKRPIRAREIADRGTGVK